MLERPGRKQGALLSASILLPQTKGFPRILSPLPPPLSQFQNHITGEKRTKFSPSGRRSFLHLSLLHFPACITDRQTGSAAHQPNPVQLQEELQLHCLGTHCSHSTVTTCEKTAEPRSHGTAGLGGMLRVTEPWNHSTAGLGGMLRVTQPWSHGTDGLGGMLRTTEPWNHGTAGLEGPQRSHKCGITARMDWMGLQCTSEPPAPPPTCPHPQPWAPPGTEHPPPSLRTPSLPLPGSLSLFHTIPSPALTPCNGSVCVPQDLMHMRAIPAGQAP